MNKRYKQPAKIGSAFFCWCLLGGMHSIAVLPVGRGELFLDVASSFEYDTNLFVNNDEVEDSGFRITPMATFEQEDGIVHLGVSAGGELGCYFDNEEENYQDFRSNVRLSFPHRENDNLTVKVDGGFNQRTAPNVDIGARMESAITNTKLDTTYKLDQRSSINGVFSYSYSDSLSQALADSTSYSVGGGYNYVYSQNLGIYGRYRYRKNRSIRPANRLTAHDHALYVGFLGRLFSKVEGILEVGMQHRVFSPERFDKQTEFYYVLGLNYQANEKIVIRLGGQRDSAVTVSNDSSINTTLSVDLDYAYDSKINYTIGANWGQSEYTSLTNPRTEDTWGGQVLMNYRFTETFTASGGVLFTHRESDNGLIDYDRTRFLITSQIRF